MLSRRVTETDFDPSGSAPSLKEHEDLVSQVFYLQEQLRDLRSTVDHLVGVGASTTLRRPTPAPAPRASEVLGTERRAVIGDPVTSHGDADEEVAYVLESFAMGHQGRPAASSSPHPLALQARHSPVHPLSFLFPSNYDFNERALALLPDAGRSSVLVTQFFSRAQWLLHVGCSSAL